jgi:hypothetical protein
MDNDIRLSQLRIPVRACGKPTYLSILKQFLPQVWRYTSLVRLWLFILAYNLGNFVRKMALPESVNRWSLKRVRTKLIKIGGRLVLQPKDARRLMFQLAEVTMTRDVFSGVLERISKLCPRPG